jgi:hypothetical protein
VVPFSIHCATCRASLRVTRAEAIGEILPCPKCGSMVHVVPPMDHSEGVLDERAVSMAVIAAPPPAAQPTPVVVEFADEAAAFLPAAPANVSPIGPTPPPLPKSYTADASVAAGEASARGVIWFAASAAAALCAVAIAWAAWVYFDRPPSVALQDTNRAELEKGTGQPDPPAANQSDTAADVVAGEPELKDAESKGEAPAVNQNTEALPQANDELKIDDSAALQNGEPAQPAPNIVGSGPPKADEASAEPSRDIPTAEESASAKEQTARKPSLQIDEIPSSPPPDEPAPVESAGQEAADAAEPDAVEAAPAARLPADAPEAGVDGDPPLQRTAPRQVDVAAQLDISLAAANFKRVPLYGLVQTLSDLAGTTISIDADALRTRGIKVDQHVTVVAESPTTIEELLEQAIAPLGLAAHVEQGQLLIAPAASAAARKARYAVDDLVRDGDPPLDDLARMIQTLVAGPHRRDQPKFELEIAEGAIFLSGSEAVHDRMIELCEKLRVARGRPLRTRYSVARPDPRFDPRRFELASRRAKAQRLLERRVTAGIGQPATLRQIAAWLAEQSDAIVLLDGPSLAVAGLSVDTQARLRAADEPLAVALARLVEPLGLVFRVVDEGVLEITTPAAAAGRSHVEFYPVRGLLAGSPADGAAADGVREKLFSAAGIDDASAAAVFDAASQCLIVSATYADHARLEQALRLPDSARRQQAAAN